MTNNIKAAFIFKALEDSEVSITDFSRLTNISRTSLYAWKRGNNVADNLRLGIAVSYAARLGKAVEIGRLPLIGTYPISERIQVLKSIIAEVNKVMKAQTS